MSDLELHVLCGIPASGKSTYAEKHAGKDDVIVSSDKIRGELYGDESIQKDPAGVFNIFYTRIESALSGGKNVWADATNLNESNRENYAPIAEKYGASLQAHIFDPPLETVLNRNEERDRKVPEEVIRRMDNHFILPSKAEGFNSVEFISYPETANEAFFDMFTGICRDGGRRAALSDWSKDHGTKIETVLWDAAQNYVDVQLDSGMDVKEGMENTLRSIGFLKDEVYAKDKISAFYEKELGVDPPEDLFSDMQNILLLKYPLNENDDHTIDVYADLDNLRLNFVYGEEIIEQHSYENISHMCERTLDGIGDYPCITAEELIMDIRPQTLEKMNEKTNASIEEEI